MKMKISGVIAMSLVLVVFTSNLRAQKIGFVDMQEIISSMPESVQSDSVLMDYRRDIYDQIQQMEKAYQQDVEKFVQDSGSLDEVKKDIVSQKLMDQRKRLIDFQRSAGQRIAQKQAALRKPLIEKVTSAMRVVAKAKGYQYMVNDFYYPNNIPFVLRKPEDADVTNAVKEQLGIKGK